MHSPWTQTKWCGEGLGGASVGRRRSMGGGETKKKIKKIVLRQVNLLLVGILAVEQDKVRNNYCVELFGRDVP